MIDFANILVIAKKELRDSLRNRWFILFALAFGTLSLAFSLLGQPESNRLELSNYSRSAASLINLVILFVPLIGLSLGASGLANDRETGALTYLLAQPVNASEVLLGKYLGMASALLAALSLGFGLAGIAMLLQGQSGDGLGYLTTVALAALLALVSLSLGFLISVLIHKSSMALTSSLLVWLILVFAGDLGMMGTSIVTKMSIQALFYLASINPLQMFKMASIMNIQAHLEVLGPVGMYASQQYGAFLAPGLLLGLLLWAILPLVLALWLFGKQAVIPQKRNAT
jgi:Cu-processing system permease protein